MIGVGNQSTHLDGGPRSVIESVPAERSRTTPKNPWPSSRYAGLLGWDRVEEEVYVHARKHLLILERFVLHNITATVNCDLVDAYVRSWREGWS